MRTKNTLIAFLFVLVFASLVTAGCVGVPQDMGGSAAPLGVEEATFPVVEFRRAGGPDGLDEYAVMYLDGHVVLEQAGDEPVTFQLSSAAQDQIDAAFDSASFFENTRAALTPTPVPDGATTYEISRHGLLLQGALTTSEATAPDWARPLIPLLNNLLLTPDPAAVTAYRPEQPTPTTAATISASPAAPSLVLVEFTRNSPDGEERVLLNLDRTYSVARGGQLSEGTLSEEEMAVLLKELEDANLREQAGDYFDVDDTDCPDCAIYELVYRNLFGEHTLRTATGQEPAWALPVLDALTALFLPEQPVAAASATVTATVQILADASATSMPSPQPSPATTPTAAATHTPTAIAQPAASPTPSATSTGSAASQYSTLDLLADLADSDAQVEVVPGRVVKPYLTAYGLIVRVDGEPLQVFQYPDEASLLADVASLDASASSINGLPLVWPAAPHFWRKGSLLALAVTDEGDFVDLISQVLGEQFAGQ